jgi:hypothetical protein
MSFDKELYLVLFTKLIEDNIHIYKTRSCGMTGTISYIHSLSGKIILVSSTRELILAYIDELKTSQNYSFYLSYLETTQTAV